MKDLHGKLVGVCVSGGLDSKTVSKRLVEDGIKVLAFSADLGQPDEDDIQVRRSFAPSRHVVLSAQILAHHALSTLTPSPLPS